MLCYRQKRNEGWSEQGEQSGCDASVTYIKGKESVETGGRLGGASASVSSEAVPAGLRECCRAKGAPLMHSPSHRKSQAVVIPL